MSENNNKTKLSPVEKNKIDNVDLKQMEYFSNLHISKETIIVTESNSTIAIAISKFLTDLGFKNIHVCKEMSEAIKIFSEFISNDISVPMIIDYEMVCGLPLSVDTRVKHLVRSRNGWQPKGEPFLMKHHGTEVLVQCMVKYEGYDVG